MNTTLERQLQQLGRSVLLWRAGVRLAWGGAVILTALWLFSLLDFLFRVGLAWRWFSGTVLLALACACAAWLWAVLRRPYSDESIAALVEKNYPELDNHLINYLQFSKESASDVFKRAYLADGAPPLATLEPARLHPPRARRRSLTFLALTVCIFLLPALFDGRSWGVSVWRMINPFAVIERPATTQLLEVQPGDISVRQGQSVTLGLRAQGVPGQSIRLDLHPDDSSRTTLVLGHLSSAGPESFEYNLPRVATRVRYRIRAGDAAPSRWYTVTPRPPPVFTSITFEVEPPAYTGRGQQVLDARAEEPRLPEGARVVLRAEANQPLEELAVEIPGRQEIKPMQPDTDRRTWMLTAVFEESGVVAIEGRDTFGDTLREELGYSIEPDRPPRVEIIAPEGQPLLPPGERPRIVFQVSDDYGLSEVLLYQLSDENDPVRARGEPLVRWPLGDGALEWHKAWDGAGAVLQEGINRFQVLARDNRPGEPNEGVSAPIVFRIPQREDLERQREALEREARRQLESVVALQKENIEHSRRLQQRPAASPAEAWDPVTGRQREIRRLTGELLRNPARPLGARATAAQGLYVNEMTLAIAALESIPLPPEEQRPSRVAGAVSLQETILRQLTAGEEQLARAAMDSRLSGIEALLKALVDNQGDLLDQTRTVQEAGATAGRPLIERQDALASDMSAFLAACEREADTLRSQDESYAATLRDVGQQGRERRIREDMLLAADRLEGEGASQALPYGERALGNLRALQEMLAGVRLQQHEQDRLAMAESLALARERVERIAALHAAMLESMDTVRGHASMNDEAFDLLWDEVVETTRNTRDAMLQVPIDLHVFNELNIANELVEDTLSIFEELEQAAGSAERTAEEAVEYAYAKNERLIEEMMEIVERFDDMEVWLSDEPSGQVTTEAFDREELPEAGIALVALAAQIQSLIGDLLEESEEHAEATHDSATTHASPDRMVRGQVEEGDLALFAGKGEAGNEVPDHKEQDGRSGIGREGMSVGETAAGGGTLEEGDPNIMARRTEDPIQSGQVELDGEGQTVATGGGKRGTGGADEFGMSGGIERLDGEGQGSWEAMAAMLARQADAIYAQASLQNVRVDALKTASRHLRQANDAIAQGRIDQAEELRVLSVSALRRARMDLEAAPTGGLAEGSRPRLVEDLVDAGPELAPPRFKQPVADYFRRLNEAL